MSMGSGAAEGLQQVLQRLFLEAQQKQQMQEHADKMSLGHRGLDVQQEENRATAGLRQAQLDSLSQERTARNEDRDAARGVQEQTQLRGNLQMMPKGTAIDDPNTIVGMVKGGLGGMLKPVQNEPRFEFSGTQQAENAGAANDLRGRIADDRTRQADERIKQADERIQQGNERLGWGPPVIQIHTTDAQGNAVTKVMPKGEATGQTFDAAPTTETRNRQTAAKRASGVVDAIAELSERINVNKGVAASAIGAVERQKAKVNLNDDISEYEGVVSGFTPMLARAVGHVGVLTEQDVQSVRQALPKPEDSKSVRDRKIKRFQSLMEGGLVPGQTISQALSGDSTGGGATDAKAKAAELLKKYGGGQ